MGNSVELKKLRLRYPGTCVACGSALPKGAEAMYHPASKTFGASSARSRPERRSHLDRGRYGALYAACQARTDPACAGGSRQATDERSIL